MPGIFWLGGGSGSGKTTVALAVCRRLDLRLYPVDSYTYAHARRAESGAYPLMRAVNAMTPAQRQEGTPAELAELFTATSAERLTMILDDVRALGDGPTILVEGPQLFPDYVAPLLGAPEHGLWLLPSPDFARSGIARRFAQVPAALERRYTRDVLLTELNRRQAAARGLPVLEVDGSLSADATVALVSRQIARLPGLTRATSGPERQRIRRAENAAVVCQLLAWWEEAIGRDRMPDGPMFPFSCECELLGCEQTAKVSVTEYQRRSAGGPITAH
ncbi:MAG: hypothetical protein ABSA02_16595 [Trebonia sp.]